MAARVSEARVRQLRRLRWPAGAGAAVGCLAGALEHGVSPIQTLALPGKPAWSVGTIAQSGVGDRARPRDCTRLPGDTGGKGPPLGARDLVPPRDGRRRRGALPRLDAWARSGVGPEPRRGGRTGRASSWAYRASPARGSPVRQTRTGAEGVSAASAWSTAARRGRQGCAPRGVPGDRSANSRVSGSSRWPTDSALRCGQRRLRGRVSISH